MVYNFKERFAPLVESGQKLTTIRAPRKDGKLPKPGEALKLFTGMRTKHCRKIGERVCKSVKKIRIRRDVSASYAYVGGRYVDPVALAHKEGFTHWWKMVQFFLEVHGLPFRGYIIEWYPRLSNELFNPEERRRRQ